VTARKKTARKKTAAKARVKATKTKKKATRKKAAKKKAAKKKIAKKKPTKKKPAKARASELSVFFFGGGQADGNRDMKVLLGGKGANLAEMVNIGIPVPPGFTISTEVCARFNELGGELPDEVRAAIGQSVARVEQLMGTGFGDPHDPLLLSVRSGARASMPGMMDTVLNLGLNDETVSGLVQQADSRFAYDSYRRLIQMYADVVLGVSIKRFENRLRDVKEARRIELDTELSADDLRGLVSDFLEIVEEDTGSPFPQDPFEQLWGSVSAVFGSWENERAKKYRRLNRIPADWGTAVNVQAMVYGNMGEGCATGVAFTRDPATGENHFYGEYLQNAQGEDVVAGIRTPQPINEASRRTGTMGMPTLEGEMPEAYDELVGIYQKLEESYRDMQDIEFTIQRGTLWMLQTRTGKRTAQAAVRIAVDMVKEGLIDQAEAVMRVEAGSLDQLLHPTLDPKAERHVLAQGLPASPGAAVGNVVFSAEEAEVRSKAGEKVLLVRIETSPEDIGGMNVAEGILTARGGMTSHAAVVARGMGKCCVSGCAALEIDYHAGTIRVGGAVIREGETITIDGSSGEVMRGEIPTLTPELGGRFGEFMEWADRFRELEVRTNADTPQDARVARDFGAQGIGLCRTEHMFFEPNRILAVREMILARSPEERKGPLERLLHMQRDDFEGIFRVMENRPVTIRLLDPPLHEFLPSDEEAIRDVAHALNKEVAQVRATLEAIREVNPMLGHRGCRLGVTFPEIYRMQVRAISEAACKLDQEGIAVKPEILIPLVGHRGELERLRAQVEEVIADVKKTQYPQTRVRPTIGTMIEVPRAALTADVIARHADFFSFGTNDLTQMAYALSRDDAGKFLPEYIALGILQDDPFVSIDEEGVGQLVQMGVEKGRRSKPEITMGVCGEHGGDPKSIRFFSRVGVDYVSCSPYRVPVARLAAAQAALEKRASRSS